MEKRPKLKSSHGRTGSPAAKGVKKSAPKKGKVPPTKPVRGKPIAQTAFARKSDGDAREPQKAKRPAKATAADSPSTASDSAREVAVLVALAALEKKAVGLEIIDVAGRVDYADFLILMSGRSDRQVSALSQGIEEALKKKNRRPVSVEGLPHAVWVLMDYGDVVVHVFQEDARGTYDLDGLFNDARRVPVPVVAEY